MELCSLVILGIVGITAWSSHIAWQTRKIIKTIKSIGGTVRGSDKIIMASALTLFCINFALLFCIPHLLHISAFAIAAWEVGVLAANFYMSELQTKNLKGVQQKNSGKALT